MSYRKIVTVVDEHTGSTVTAGYAMWLAKSCNAELVLYSAFPAKSPQTAEHAERHLSHLQTEASALGIAATSIRETGELEKLLPATTHSQNADLLFTPSLPASPTEHTCSNKRCTSCCAPLNATLQSCACGTWQSRIPSTS